MNPAHITIFCFFALAMFWLGIWVAQDNGEFSPLVPALVLNLVLIAGLLYGVVRMTHYFLNQ